MTNDFTSYINTTWKVSERIARNTGMTFAECAEFVSEKWKSEIGVTSDQCTIIVESILKGGQKTGSYSK